MDITKVVGVTHADRAWLVAAAEALYKLRGNNTSLLDLTQARLALYSRSLTEWRAFRRRRCSSCVTAARPRTHSVGPQIWP